MAHRYFEGKVHALLYKKYRPVPPTTLIEGIVSYLKEEYTGALEIAYDVGCGSGQSTVFLSPYFCKVIGTDISTSMIQEANANNRLPNVTYKVNPAEVIPAADKSVQLIAASQAAHWFDLKKFYAEGNRVLCPSGVMALFGYEFPKLRVNEQDGEKNRLLKKALDDLYKVDLHNCWAAERKLVDRRYENFVIPYENFVRNDNFYHELETNVSDIGNYVLTWSGYQKYCKNHGDKEGKTLITKFQNRIMEILNATTDPNETKIVKRTSYFLLMARTSKC